MSFSAEVKTELCRHPLTRRCCALAEAYGILLCAPVFSHQEIRLATEHALLAKRIQMLLQRVFSIDLLPQRVGRKFQFVLSEHSALRRVFDTLGYDFKNNVSYHLNRNVLEHDCCPAAFIRGVFLAIGTVAGPDKKSHLELAFSHKSFCNEVVSILLDMHMTPGQTVRRASYVLYFKDSASVEDFLTLIGASRAAMELMEAKVEKDIRNTINRQVNCETANLMKSTEASARQIACIRMVLEKSGIAFFPEALRETVELRLLYPTDSLAELAARFDPPISKPGLSHRLRKITQLAVAEGK